MKILKEGEFYGQKKKALEVNGVLLSEYAYVIPKTDWHYHENPYFMYLLQGQLYDVNKKSKRKCNQGTLLFHNWQEQHFNSKHSQFAQGFHIELKKEYFEKLGIEMLNSEGSSFIDNPIPHLLLSKLYYEFHLKDDFSEIGIEYLLIELCRNVDKVINHQKEKPQWLNSLIEIIYERNDPLKLKDLTAQLGVHPVHISRTFSQHFDCTLSEYMRMTKVKKSIPFILKNKYSLTEISYLCGFADQSHFSKTFRYYMGMSPSSYKARIA